MKLYSTNDKSNIVSLEEAVFKSLPKDKGLYMPSKIPQLPNNFIENLSQYSFPEIGYQVTSALFDNCIPKEDLRKIIDSAITFPAPLVKLDENLFVLELFHGPSLAFKDFGARFMAQLMSYFYKGSQQKLTILVATSGDTGGAVAAGFHHVEGIEVIILYPSGKVSSLQEKQLTTLGGNITALEIDGTFDDCQALVKQAFLDEALNESYQLSSANSINIARLIPQSFYYFEAYKQLSKDDRQTVFCVPSGNFGNLTAGLLAKRMGLPIDKFIAATNINDVVPEYLQTGIYNPRPSERTISNAMDVGNPSNFVRMSDLFSFTWNNFREYVEGYSVDDSMTEQGVKTIYEKYSYTIDPHGAVGIEAVERYRKEKESNIKAVVLETAHPAKFPETMNRILDQPIEIPKRLSVLESRTKVATPLGKDFLGFKNWLLLRSK